MSTCGVQFCVRGVARSLHTLGFPSAPSPRVRLRQPPHKGLTTAPSSVRYESGSRASALFLLDNNSTETNDLMCQSDRLASRADCFSLSLCQPDHFGPDEHTRLLRHRTSLSRASRLHAQHLASSRLDSHPESRDHITGVCLRTLARATHPV